MAQHVAFVELPVFSGVLPLASCYMEACCRRDPVLSAEYGFEKISLSAQTELATALAALERADADVYAFSCYVWNTRLVRRLVDALRAQKPGARFVLGGPQVMRQGRKYLTPEMENVYVCNGEGERTFASLLRTWHRPGGDPRQVRGLSFYRDGELTTTENEPRITDLSEIPSPFLEGVFEAGRYTWMLIETNRGCPFACNYCFWGGATGAKVNKFDEERVRRELEWISRSGCWYLFIADANWGMLARDVELTRFITDCHKRHGSPLTVTFCGSKNTPQRVAEISRLFQDAGMVASQSVALQTQNEETLRRVKRSNIRTSTYTELQRSLNASGTPSFVELIWPLPGETLESFQEGIGQLCTIGAETFAIYPLLLINNVELADHREEYGLVTVPDSDPSSEAEIVVQTSEVDEAAYDDGCRFSFAVSALYSARALWHLMHYLNRTGRMPYAEMLRSFVAFSLRHPRHPWTRFCEASIRQRQNAAFSNVGATLHLILHEDRDAFDGLLEAFVADAGFGSDPRAQCLFEFDLISRPYVYQNTPIRPKQHRFSTIRIAGVRPDGYIVEVPPQDRATVGEYLALEPPDGTAAMLTVNHRRAHVPFMPRKSMAEHYEYCNDMARRLGHLAPVWRTLAGAIVRPAVRDHGAVTAAG